MLRGNTILRAATLELGNLRAAWSWACQNKRADWLDLAAEAFSQLLDARNLYAEAGDAFSDALKALDSAGDGQAEVIRKSTMQGELKDIVEEVTRKKG